MWVLASPILMAELQVLFAAELVYLMLVHEHVCICTGAGVCAG